MPLLTTLLLVQFTFQSFALSSSGTSAFDIYSPVRVPTLLLSSLPMLIACMGKRSRSAVVSGGCFTDDDDETIKTAPAVVSVLDKVQGFYGFAFGEANIQIDLVGGRAWYNFHSGVTGVFMTCYKNTRFGLDTSRANLFHLHPKLRSMRMEQFLNLEVESCNPETIVHSVTFLSYEEDSKTSEVLVRKANFKSHGMKNCQLITVLPGTTPIVANCPNTCRIKRPKKAVVEREKWINNWREITLEEFSRMADTPQSKLSGPFWCWGIFDTLPKTPKFKN